MKKTLAILALSLAIAAPAAAQFGGRIGSAVPNIKLLIEKGTFTPTGPWNFQGPITFSSTTVFVGGSSVSANAPITGDGTDADPLGLDSSSVTLQGNAFNGPNQLVTTNGAGKLPPVDGSLLTNIAATGVILQAKNKTGATVNAGQVVYIDGAQGSSPTFQLAQADDHLTSHAIGIVKEEIPNNQNGAILQFGLVTDVDTSAFAEGAQLYLSTSVPGGLADVPPGPESHVVHLGVVAKSNAVTGSFIALIWGDHPQTGSVANLFQAVQTQAELQTFACPNYPTDRCLIYNSTDDRVYASTGPLAGQFRDVGSNVGP